MKTVLILLVVVPTATLAAGCGGGHKTSHNLEAAAKKCSAVVGFEGPLSGASASVGEEQLAFARLAVANDNRARGTNLRLLASDTRLTPSRALTAAQQMVSNPKVLAIVGPAGNQEVNAVGPFLARAGMAYVSSLATATSLTDGANPTFFRVVPTQAAEAPQAARFILARLGPKAVLVIDDGSAASRTSAGLTTAIFRQAGISTQQSSVDENMPDFSSVVAKTPPAVRVIVLAWRGAANAERLGQSLVAQRKQVTLVGPSDLYSPGEFTISGAYLSWLAPDITALANDVALVRQARAAFPNFGTIGPPAYAATHVIDDAISAVCRSGQIPARSSVLSAIRATNQRTSVLGEPIRFDARGDLVGARWFIFRITAAGQYQFVPGP